MRKITSHKVNGLNESIDIEVRDEPGAGGACHQYRITHPVLNGRHIVEINFQNGPIANGGGMNGISNEALLAIVEDRLKGFQSGPFAGRENALALTHVQEAMHWLHHRTRERLARGVEGSLEQ